MENRIYKTILDTDADALSYILPISFNISNHLLVLNLKRGKY